MERCTKTINFGNDDCSNYQLDSVAPGQRLAGTNDLNNRSCAQQKSFRREERREAQAPQAPSQKIGGATGVSPIQTQRSALLQTSPSAKLWALLGASPGLRRGRDS